MNAQKQICLFLLSLPLCCLMLSLASAQFLQPGTKLVGTGAVGNAEQGISVAISSDGNTAIVGGYYDNGAAGAAWIYTRNGDVWAQQGSKLFGTGGVGNANQGISVAISADGNTAIVGGNNDNGFAGAAWVYTRIGSVWTQQGSKLVGTGAVGNANQGISVSLSADGNTAIVGGFYDSTHAGAAWVYTRSGGVWTQQGGKLVGTGAVGNAEQGISVSLSADGNTAIVGGNNDNGFAGAAWMYIRSGGVWTQQGSKLVGTGAVGNAEQGTSVSISNDGNTAIVGGYFDNSYAGAAWVYTRNGSVWTQQGSKLVGIGGTANANQGSSVSLSADGNAAIVGGYFDNSYAGAAWVYIRSVGVWTQQGSKLVGTGAVGNAYQGISVSLSADGSSAIVGGYVDNGNTGAAWVYFKANPKIVSISDIPHDQGGSVRIKWNKFLLDSTGVSQQTTSYGLWRKIPPALSVAGHKRSAPPQGMSLLNDSLSQYDYLMTVNAVQIPYYNVVVPTLADSSVSGIPYFTYLLTAHTADPNVYYVSKPDSGYSVDNLAPIPPAGLVASIQAGPNVNLTWNAPTDTDVKSYAIYRSTTSGFAPAPENNIGTSGSTSFIDASPISGFPSYYRIIAVDLHDNRSLPSPEAEAKVYVNEQLSVQDDWNMVSVPLIVSDFTKTGLFPTANGNAFGFSGGYVRRDTLINGSGYWLKFNGQQNVNVSGLDLTLVTVNVQPGWNMIGSVSKPIAAATINSHPGAIVTSQFFGYNGQYTVADSIRPGNAYWVKVSQSGMLILTSGPLPPGENRIRIIPTSELPPQPPAETIAYRTSHIPHQFSLEQNYPNPFNPVTRIEYALPVNEHVKLSVFNVLGQEVSTLVNEVQDAGYKSVSFDASRLPSGIYTYKITAGTFTDAKKMLLLK